MEVCGHQDVQGFGPEDHPGRGRIDQHSVRLNVGVTGGRLLKNGVPHDHAVALGVGLGHQGEEAPRALPGQLEGEPHDPGDPDPGEDGHLHPHLFRMPLVGPPSDTGVFALRVLADDDPVQVPGAPIPQGAPDARQNPGGTDVGVLIEALADGEAQPHSVMWSGTEG